MGTGPVDRTSARRPVELPRARRLRAAGRSPTSCAGRANGTVSAYAYCRLGDITADQFRALAEIQRDFGVEVRITNRQNFVLRGPHARTSCPTCTPRLGAIDMAEPGAELARDVVGCPGADTCNLAVTQSRGLADDIGRGARGGGPGRGRRGARSTSPAARTRAASTTSPTSASSASSAAPTAAPRPATRCCSAGRSATWRSRSARRRRSSRPRRRPRRSCGSSASSPASASAGETFADWLDRSGGAAARRHRAQGPRRVPDARREPRLLRRLRRDRPVRGRSRRQRVRHMTRRSATATAIPDLAELADVVGVARAPARPSAAVGVGVATSYGDGLVLAASFQDCVLDRPRGAGRARHRGRVPRHPVPLRRDALVRRADPRAATTSTSRVMQPEVDARRPLAQTTPTAAARVRKVEPLGRGPGGQGGLDDRPPPRRGAAPGPNAPIVAYDVGRGLVKVNPLATWTDLDVDGLHPRPRPPRCTRSPTAATPRSAAGRAPVPSATARTPAPAAGPAPTRSSAASTRRPGSTMTASRLNPVAHDASGQHTGPVQRQLSHLEALEAESIHIIREVAAEFERPVPAVLGRQGLGGAAAAGREGVPARADPVPDHARRHRAQLPRGARVPRPARRRARRPAHRRLGAGRHRPPAASSRTGPGRRATGSRPPTLLEAIEEHRFDAVFGGGAPRRGEGPGQGARLLASATSSGSGTRRTSGPSCGACTTAAPRRRAPPRVPAVELDRARRVAVHRRRRRSSFPRSTSPTAARCSARDGMLLAVGPTSCSPATARSRSRPWSGTGPSAT